MIETIEDKIYNLAKDLYFKRKAISEFEYSLILRHLGGVYEEEIR